MTTLRELLRGGGEQSRALCVSQLLSPERLKRVTEMADSLGLPVSIAPSVGGRTSWAAVPEQSRVVWAQPNRLGVVERGPPVEARRQVVTVTPILAPATEGEESWVWHGDDAVAPASAIGPSDPAEVSAAQRVLQASRWLARALRAVPRVQALTTTVAGKVPALCEEDPGAVSQRLLAAGFDATPEQVAGLPGLVVITVDQGHGRGDLDDILRLLGGEPSGQRVRGGTSQGADDLPRRRLTMLRIP